VARFDTHLSKYKEEFDILSKPGSSLEWTVGGFFIGQTSRQVVNEFEGTGANPVPRPAANIETARPGNLAYRNDSHVSRKSESIFAQATYHLRPKVRLTLGERFNHDSDRDNSDNFSAFGISTVNHGATDNVPTWRAEADYDATPDNMIYVSAARGYKPGGVNGSYGQIVVPVAFQPETNTAFELGSKNDLFDHALRLNVAGFYYLYNNMQYIETDPAPPW
jgi:iron complex outermembrane receptor protein